MWIVVPSPSCSDFQEESPGCPLPSWEVLCPALSALPRNICVVFLAIVAIFPLSLALTLPSAKPFSSLSIPRRLPFSHRFLLSPALSLGDQLLSCLFVLLLVSGWVEVTQEEPGC